MSSQLAGNGLRRGGLLWAAVLAATGAQSLRADAVSPPCVSEGLAEVLAATCRVTDGSTSGTGFLVGRPVVGKSNRAVLITCAHTFKGIPGNETKVILRARRDSTLARREVALPLRSNGMPLWKAHAEADVAAVAFDLPEDSACQPLKFDRLAAPDDFTNGAFCLGSEAWIFTYPAQLEANKGFPVLRHGNISSLPLAPVPIDATFLIDVSAFGGDSGAAVWVEGSHGKRGRVAGLVIGMQRQTDHYSIPFEDRTVHYPLGLSIALEAGAVRELILSLPK